MKRPSGPNSNSCAALAAYAGPLVLPRENTNTCFLELTATPVASPKYIFGGSFNGSGIESNGISGAASCADAGAGVGAGAGCCANAAMALKARPKDAPNILVAPYEIMASSPRGTGGGLFRTSFLEEASLSDWEGPVSGGAPGPGSGAKRLRQQ